MRNKQSKVAVVSLIVQVLRVIWEIVGPFIFGG